MAPRRLLLPLLAAVLAMVASCSTNQATAPGVSSELLVRAAGPTGVAPTDLNQPWAWAVNTIDSLILTEDIDSTLLEVVSVRLTDPQGTVVPGTTRWVASNAYIQYTQPFPSTAYDFVIKNPPARSTLGKMYFIPSVPLRGHTEYTLEYTGGLRMTKGNLRRDVYRFSYTTGDSIAPPFVDPAGAGGRPN
jgi:hypothetical protein